mmetsp:Transcript_71875/g.198424  ORF Transcript_71875/g.198424 Transcript_71875/m.198424 type:complete len:279 (+) Transcript_71875:746-1582(+)
MRPQGGVDWLQHPDRRDEEAKPGVGAGEVPCMELAVPKGGAEAKQLQDPAGALNAHVQPEPGALLSARDVAEAVGRDGTEGQQATPRHAHQCQVQEELHRRAFPPELLHCTCAEVHGLAAETALVESQACLPVFAVCEDRLLCGAWQQGALSVVLGCNLASEGQGRRCTLLRARRLRHHEVVAGYGLGCHPVAPNLSLGANHDVAALAVAVHGNGASRGDAKPEPRAPVQADSEFHAVGANRPEREADVCFARAPQRQVSRRAHLPSGRVRWGSDGQF